MKIPTVSREKMLAKLTSVCFQRSRFRRTKFSCKRNTALSRISRIFVSVGLRESHCMHGARPKSGDNGGKAAVETRKGNDSRICVRNFAGVPDSSLFRSITGYESMPLSSRCIIVAAILAIHAPPKLESVAS